VFGRLLASRTVLFLGFLTLVGVAIAAWDAHRARRRLIEVMSIQDAERAAQALGEFRTLYTSEVVERVRPAGILVTHDYANHAGSIPLPATLSMAIGNRLSASGHGVQTRLYSDFPFPFRKDGGPRNAFESDALAALRRDPDRPFWRFEDLPEGRVLKYASADRMRAACVNCHNTHADSPKKDWKVGDVRGVLEVVLPLAAAEAEASRGFGQHAAILAALGLLAIAGIAIVVARLRRDSAALAATIRERTAELEARTRDLERSNTELELFASVASHDMQEPLRMIRSYCELLQKRYANQLDDSADEFIAYAVDGATRLQKMVQSLLDYSRVGRTPRPPADVHLNETFEIARRNLQEALKDAGGRATAGDLPAVKGDPGLLVQLFQNLIANGLKFRRDEAPEVKVEARRQGAAWVFAFQDNGIGIPAEERDKLFQPFQRLASGQRFRGTGLGLATCRRIVEYHGGRIWVESEVGKGTTVFFSLPDFDQASARSSGAFKSAPPTVPGIPRAPGTSAP
jgi:signal transduction histidine kinase